MNITRIEAPKFKVGRYSLNEYEVRQLQLEVAQGLKPSGITVKDRKGVKATILQNGSMSQNLDGYGINSQLSLKLLPYKGINICQ